MSKRHASAKRHPWRTDVRGRLKSKRHGTRNWTSWIPDKRMKTQSPAC